MSASAGTAGAPSPADRERIEADLTRDRIVELALNPVRGNFDAAHLREVNRRIFQDMPASGFTDVTPGQYRPEVPEGQDWLKNRGLSTVSGSFMVAYSRMDATAQAKIEAVLADAKPKDLARLETKEFTQKIAKVYAELDFAHPFSDGNSRTLRTFTRQLAREAGYDLNWDRFNQSDKGRDSLYVARDLSVNEIALPGMASHNAMVRVAHAIDSLAGNPNLDKILEGTARPLRAMAFERDAPADAVRKHPELEGAYVTLHAATKFASTLEASTQDKFLQQAREKIQSTLNAGKLVPEPPMKSKERDVGRER